MGLTLPERLSTEVGRDLLRGLEPSTVHADHPGLEPGTKGLTVPRSAIELAVKAWARGIRMKGFGLNPGSLYGVSAREGRLHSSSLRLSPSGECLLIRRMGSTWCLR